MFVGPGGLWPLLILIGLVVALVAVLRPGAATSGRGDRGRAETILGERLAAGEISESEYRERLTVLEADRPARPAASPWVSVVLAAAVVVLAVLLLLSFARPGAGGWWPGMGGAPTAGAMADHMRGMGGHMGGMMGSRGATAGTAPAPTPDAAEIVVEAGDMWFEPAEIEVVAGEPVNLTLVNSGRVFHDLVIEGLDFRLVADPGESTSGGLEVDAPGVYEFLCTVPGHEAAGMRGTLTVLDAAP